MDTFVRTLVAAAASLALLAGTQALAQGKNHRSAIITYIACDKDYAQPISEKSVSGLRWKASWNGDAFSHSPGPGTAGAPHPDAIMRYLTWDGTCWEARWDAAARKFSHKRVASGQVHSEGYINYLAWDRSKWTSIREGNEFQHVFIGDAEYKPKAEEVREVVNKAGKVISVVVKVLSIF